MPALLILYSTVIIQEKGGGRVEGDCPVKGVAGRSTVYAKWFDSELFPEVGVPLIANPLISGLTKN
jgi:hypothetical protein